MSRIRNAWRALMGAEPEVREVVKEVVKTETVLGSAEEATIYRVVEEALHREGEWVGLDNLRIVIDDPPFRTPVFVVTHYARETVTYPNGTEFHFVTDGVESAVAQAREAANGKDVRVGGGAEVATQCLRAGLLDRIDLHVAPVLLGGGVRLFEGVDLTRLELVESSASEKVAHLSYRPT